MIPFRTPAVPGAWAEFDIFRKAALEMSNYYILTNLLSDDERRVITSIVRHIELGGNKVGIQQIASENYGSTAFIRKLCKRLGFAGYSEL